MKINVLDISFEYNGTSQTINPVIIQDNETMILIDTGYPDQIGLLEESAKQNDISLDKLTHIIITHHDYDHVGSLAALKRRFPHVKILASRIEKEYIEKQRKPLRLEQAEKIYPSLSEVDKEQALIFHKTLESVEGAEVNEVLENHQILPVGNGIEVVFTPGHTAGHISLYIKENKTFIAGDALVLMDDKLVIPYPHFAYDADKAKESVKHLFSYEIEELICYHGGLIKSNWKDLLS